MNHLSKLITLASAAILALMATAIAQADTITPLTALNIDSFNGNAVSPSIGNYSFTFSPTLTLPMGGYAGTLFNQTDTSTGVSVSLQSTSAYGGNPLSGTADTTVGTMTLDLSSLYGSITYPGLVTYTGTIWSSNSSILQNNYDPSTGAFTYQWENTSTASVYGVPTSFTYDITLHGNGTTVSTVPLPATAWLFGSGLLGLIGFARRNKV